MVARRAHPRTWGGACSTTAEREATGADWGRGDGPSDVVSGGPILVDGRPCATTSVRFGCRYGAARPSDASRTRDARTQRHRPLLQRGGAPAGAGRAHDPRIRPP